MTIARDVLLLEMPEAEITPDARAKTVMKMSPSELDAERCALLHRLMAHGAPGSAEMLAESMRRNAVLPDGLEPLLKIYKQLADAGLKTYAPFTADPKPMDPVHLPVTKAEQAAVDKIYDRMDELEELNMKLGMRNKNDWSCACYLPEMGNTPSRGDYLAWSESSAINYVNSVLGARTNRNSMGIDMLCNICSKPVVFLKVNGQISLRLASD